MLHVVIPSVTSLPINIGISGRATFPTHSSLRLRRIVGCNREGASYCIQKIAPLLLKEGNEFHGFGRGRKGRIYFHI